MKTLPWKSEPSGFPGRNNLELTVPIDSHLPDSEYHIHCVARPPYCDRGDWLILMEGRNDVDGSDGFPRYFFGSEGAVKKQMETWLNKREAYRKTL